MCFKNSSLGRKGEEKKRGTRGKYREENEGMLPFIQQFLIRFSKPFSLPE